MQVKTWLQRLTDESNLWFNAVKAEDEGDLASAASGYVQDASMCLEQNLARAALSCTCAASCLVRLGSTSQGRGLYRLGAEIYLRHSELVMSESIREAMWSLQEALENFVLAGDRDLAAKIRKRYLALAARTNPFARQPALRPSPAVEMKDASAPTTASVNTTFHSNEGKNVQLPQQVTRQIQKLVERHERLSRTKSQGNADFDPSYIMRSIDFSGGSKISEKSIAS